MALSSYGDSEAESEDDEDDEEVGAALEDHGEEDEDDFDSGTTACLLLTCTACLVLLTAYFEHFQSYLLLPFFAKVETCAHFLVWSRRSYNIRYLLYLINT